MVQDCLDMINNLLRNNPSNQLMFRCVYQAINGEMKASIVEWEKPGA